MLKVNINPFLKPKYEKKKNKKIKEFYSPFLYGGGSPTAGLWATTRR